MLTPCVRAFPQGCRTWSTCNSKVSCHRACHSCLKCMLPALRSAKVDITCNCFALVSPSAAPRPTRTAIPPPRRRVRCCTSGPATPASAWWATASSATTPRPSWTGRAPPRPTPPAGRSVRGCYGYHGMGANGSAGMGWGCHGYVSMCCAGRPHPPQTPHAPLHVIETPLFWTPLSMVL